MKKLFAIIAILGSISLSSFAQSHSDRITFGVGLLYERGLDATLAWEHETKYHNAWVALMPHLHGNTKPSIITPGNTSLMAISNGMSAKVVGMCVLNHSGKTTVHGVLALPTSLVCGEVVTIMGIYASEPVLVVIRTSSWVASMLATSTIMR